MKYSLLLAQDKIDGDSTKKRSLRKRDGTGWGKAVVSLDEKGVPDGTLPVETSPATFSPKLASDGTKEREKAKRSKSIGENKIEEESKKESRPARRPLMKAKTTEHKRVK